ncbi:MAG: hypothetical protein JRJ79_15685 [Deltaproteobacteria bacterium]|nr:hypothetical protein [Deltaproteobacteria bacterium]
MKRASETATSQKDSPGGPEEVQGINPVPGWYRRGYRTGWRGVKLKKCLWSLPGKERDNRMAKDKAKDEPVMTIDLTDELNDDWLRAARLQRAAEKGDKKAAEELKRMEGEKLVPVDSLPDQDQG